MKTSSRPNFSDQVRQEESMRKTEEAIQLPPHESVKHVNADALRFLAAAEEALRNDNLYEALYLVGMAQGVAIALRDVAGALEGIREGAVLRKVAMLACELSLKAAQAKKG
jgi:hypothetical protein